MSNKSKMIEKLTKEIAELKLESESRLNTIKELAQKNDRLEEENTSIKQENKQNQTFINQLKKIIRHLEYENYKPVFDQDRNYQDAF